MYSKNGFKYLVFIAVLFTAFHLNAQSASAYKIKIGELTIPLKLLNPPNGYNGRKELFKEDLLANIDKPISFLNGDSPMYGNKLMLYYLPNKREPTASNTVTYTIELTKDAKFPDDVVSRIKEKLGEGDNLSLQSASVVDKINVNSLTLFIKDPTAPYRAPVNPVYNNEPGVYTFQIVGGLSKTLVKLDTTQASNKKYIGIYSDKNKYDLMHIAGYKTKYRYIKVTENPLEDVEVSKTINLSKLKLRPTYLYPEVAVDAEYTCSLNWGTMVANPVTGIQSLDIFNLNRKTPLKLNVPNEHYTIIQCDVIIAPERGDIIRYVVEDTNDPELQKAFDQIKERTTVYFQNIMLKNEANQIIYCPMYYAYPIAAK